jgi:glycine cleavage system H protein
MDNVAFISNCVLPRDLYYAVEQHLWIRPLPSNRVTLGFTDVAQTTAGSMLTVSYRPIGKFYPRNKVVALVESGKWLGALRTPIAGVLIAVNETLPSDATLMNSSPYNKGWVVQLEPTNLAEDLALLKTGNAAVAAYEAFMVEKQLDDCVHCEGYEFPE